MLRTDFYNIDDIIEIACANSELVGNAAKIMTSCPAGGVAALELSNIEGLPLITMSHALSSLNGVVDIMSRITGGIFDVATAKAEIANKNISYSLIIATVAACGLDPKKATDIWLNHVESTAKKDGAHEIVGIVEKMRKSGAYT